MKKQNNEYFEELDYLTQETMIDLIVSIIENKRIEEKREDREDE
jgi:hypothetical protein